MGDSIKMMDATGALAEIKNRIRDVPDFPKPGIMFKDITPLLADGVQFSRTLALLGERVAALKPTAIVAIESRGFIFGAPIAAQLGVGFIPVRKPGKLPYRTKKIEYALEYGSGILEMHDDALIAGTRVVIVDDVLATGGTARASADLITQHGAHVVGYAFVIELSFLDGRKRLGEGEVTALLKY
jgi:adenine phosphoribosyltransferase